MPARSVVLSVMLGAHPAWASAAELIRLTSDFGIKEATLRVALTRMVGAGDLVRSADGYRLSDRLLARQRRQDDAMRPQLRPWHGFWTTLIVTSVGTNAGIVPRCEPRCNTNVSASSAKVCGCGRTTSNSTWIPRSATGCESCRPVTTHPTSWPHSYGTYRRGLAPVNAWLTRCPRQRYSGAIRDRRRDRAPPVDRSCAAGRIAAREWPGTRLRAVYNDFATELLERRDDIQLVEAT